MEATLVEVPTLSEWAMIIAFILLAGLAVLRLRKSSTVAA